jgi:hypothetical protein
VKWFSHPTGIVVGLVKVLLRGEIDGESGRQIMAASRNET